MDEHRKMAIEVRSKIAKAVFEDKVSSRDIDEVEYKIIEDALRTTASNSEKDGWNKAIESVVNLIQESIVCQECGGAGWYAQQVSDTEQEQRRCDCCVNGHISDISANSAIEAIYRLIREEGK